MHRTSYRSGLTHFFIKENRVFCATLGNECFKWKTKTTKVSNFDVVYVCKISARSVNFEIGKVTFKGSKNRQKSVNLGFFGCSRWRPLYNWWKMCFLDAKCSGENFGMLFVRIGWVCGELQVKGQATEIGHFGFFSLFCFILLLLG